MIFLTNNFALPAATICALYKARWQVELVLQMIAVSVYVLVAIVKKRLNLDASLYTLLQILSLTLFEKMPIQQAFTGNNLFSNQDGNNNQMNLFAF